MWIVDIALKRPYTFIVLALLILLVSPLVVSRTPVDIFPNVNIPVIAALWGYTGLSAEEMESRIVTPYERSITVVVTDIEHMESQSVNGRGIVKVFFQPGVKPDMAMTQMTAVGVNSVRQMPPGTTPPFMIVYSASSVPILQLSLSGEGLSEQQLFDFGTQSIRTQLATVQGAAVPNPYGGKQRQIVIDLDPALMQSKNLSPADVVSAVASQNLILPAGTSKIGQFEYDIALNASPKTIRELNDLPIRSVGDSTVYVRDVAHVRDGFSPQTNVVRRDGQRGSLVTIMKTGTSSTLDIVEEVRAKLKQIATTLPPELKIDPIADQSLFVRAAVEGVLKEAIIAACLTAIMILLFLGSWRSTLIIAVSIPLSILVSVCILSWLGETINIMTLGGLALAVGILVDDATVTIENIDRKFDEGDNLHDGIRNGAAQIALPALVSTLCICIVFLPMFFLTGVARYLFVPMAEAVVFAMLASYVLSRTLVPTLAMYLLKGGGHSHAPVARWNLAGRFQRSFERGFEWARNLYRDILDACIRRKGWFMPAFLLAIMAVFLLVPWLGQDFFPTTDGGRFTLHFRARTGTRIEETARLADLIEASIRRTIPSSELSGIIDNIGLPYSGINMAYSNSMPVGTMDADIMVELKEGHKPTADYVRQLRAKLPQEFPGIAFYFLPADIISQILNFGQPAPIDVQISGPNREANRQFAANLLRQLQTIPGAVDLRVHQLFDQPRIQMDVDRIKALTTGITELDVASSMLVSLSGSFQTTPQYWLDPGTGVSYSVVTQTPQHQLASLADLKNIPVSTDVARRPQRVENLVDTSRAFGLPVVSHYDIQRAIDIFGSVQDRDLGGVADDITKIVDANRKDLPRGSQMTIRGQIGTMQSSFQGLIGGIGMAIVLVYLLIVVTFQSWLDPFIIITALPAALAGIVLALFITHTTISVPALMGAIMSVGVATANSILVVSFAKERLDEHGDAARAALEAGFTRLRPVLMTASAMIIGMVPMALGAGEGGEQNAPLGRAVIGGLTLATVATLFFVPVVFSFLHRNRRVAYVR